MVRHSHRSAAHDQRSAEDQRCISILILDERKKSTMHARCHDGWSTPAGARTAAIAGACRQSCRRALRWPAPAEPRAESGTAARTAGSRGGRPGPATTEVHRHARRYARRAGHAAGGRADEQASARHEAASRADQAAGARRSAWTAAGQHSALGGWSGEQARAVRTLASHGVRHVRQSLPNAPRVWTAVNKRFALRTSPHGRPVRSADA